MQAAAAVPPGKTELKHEVKHSVKLFHYMKRLPFLILF
ncbi:hypothetical protein HNR65_002234 [Desulfosalsimonas propionicica]|uniref:Uncharacterized protein n=1 Tax=Desulfosalsimonas propionicica TaxID=332175 RepID=A0A7W0CA15_9BACT|nr:hypothetical protein [Desulfosalsimonas propionicica]